MKIDFLCVGYAKCGTSSLDGILRQYKQIQLPIIKEPHFFDWKDKVENPLEKLYSEYFEKPQEGKKVGIIDPTLVKTKINEMDSYFGEDTKIIVMMRNPTKALFSEFKMGLRLGYYWGYYFPFKNTSTGQKFEQFFRDCEAKRADWKKPELFCYDKYLKTLMETRKKEDIYIIIFEEFIKNPNRYKKELEDFLSLEPEEVDFNVWKNEGSQISRNYFFARYNNWRFMHLYNSPDVKKKILGRKLKRFDKYTMVSGKDKILKETEVRCNDFYRESKNKVAELIGKNLDKVWFE